MTVTRVAARNGNGGDLRQSGCPRQGPGPTTALRTGRPQ